MYLWEQKRQLKVSMLQKEKEEIDFDFNPTIKSGKRTRPRFLQKTPTKSCNRIDKSQEFTNNDGSAADIRKYREQMTPRMNSKSIQIMNDRYNKTSQCVNKSVKNIYDECLGVKSTCNFKPGNAKQNQYEVLKTEPDVRWKN